MTVASDSPGRRGAVARVASWAGRHRRIVVIGWIVVLVGTLGISSAVGTNYSNNFALPGTESQRAADLLKHNFHSQSGDTDQIVLNAPGGRVTEPALRARVEGMLKEVAALPHVSSVVSPYSPAGAHAISASGQIAFATVNFDERANLLPKGAIERVIATAERARTAQLEVQLGGYAIEQTKKPALGIATGAGLLAAVVILFITFGSLLSMGLPIGTALLGLGTGIGLAGLASQLIGLPNFAIELAAIIGLGVGIDYALFIITRFRENYRAGAELQPAIDDAMDSAGRAVLFAGITVIIALLGQFLLGVSFLYGLAIASALAVLLTMLAALTFLPAVLSRFGARVGRARARGRTHPPRHGAEPGGFWASWAKLIERHPWPAAFAGLAIMLVLAAPVLALRLGNSDAGNNPPSDTTRQAYDLIARGFGPGSNAPLLVVARLPRAGDTAAVASVASVLEATPNVASVSPARMSPDRRTAVLNAYPRSSPESLATSELVKTLRRSELPPLARVTGATLLVGGPQATTIDFTGVLSSKLPLFIGIVVLLSALLLLIVFRSLVIPIQAAAMNLLSIGASLGVVVAIFQWGWLGSLFNVQGAPIAAFIPVMLFAIVFGLSMDYEVFLVSRIHEEWVRRGDATVAVTRGVATTGRVITAAAAIMICVFASLAVGDERVLKLFGLSLATAVFLDAFVVRSLLLPAVLQLLGARAWVFPSWLERRLPRLAIDQPTTPSDTTAISGDPVLDASAQVGQHAQAMSRSTF